VQSLQALRIEDGDVELDGRLADAVWGMAEVTSGFTQREPDDGSPATERTEVRVLYTASSIYIGVRAFDSEPADIRAELVRRDRGSQSDELTVYLDSFHDRRTAFAFTVNPKGSIRDVYYFNDSRRSDASWDPVWQVETAIDGQGWTAEFRIPLTQLRFNRENTTWGLQVERRIQRKAEDVYWAPYSKESSGFASLFGLLTGLYGLSQPMRLELRPYSVVNNRNRPPPSGSLYAPAHETDLNVGLDLQYGLTSDFTLDLTVNPDFGQVEADPAVMNLSAFETFFPEKRPFFVEGSGLFNQWVPGGQICYSRRVGRPPPGWVDPPDGGTVQIPESSTILAAAKVTGKSAGGFGLGIMSAMTAREHATLRDSTGAVVGGGQVAPLTFHLVSRAEQDFREGSHTLGGMITAVNRDLTDNLDFLRTAAYSAELDGQLRWQENTYAVRWQVAASHVRGSPNALTNTQRSSVRYYQRPDAPHVDLDTTRTSLSGYALSLGAGKEAGTWQYEGWYERISPGFEIRDMGFLWIADRQTTNANLRYLRARPQWIFRNYRLIAAGGGEWTTAGELLSTWFRPVYFTSTFSNNWSFWATPIIFGQDHLMVTALRGGPALRGDFWHNSNFGFETDSRKALALEFWAGGGACPACNGKWYNLGSDVVFRPAPFLNGRLGLNYSRSDDPTQWVTRATALDTTRYVLARIDQKTLRLTARVDWAFTPTLSLQLYAQPFVSSGTYSEYKEVIRPRASLFEDRFRLYTDEVACNADLECEVDLNGNGEADFSFGRPDFNYRQFNSTLVFRWEYRPGSVVFFAWQHGRGAYLSQPRFGGFRDMWAILDENAFNTFLVKLNYWIGF
jgi:hypothetical protein